MGLLAATTDRYGSWGKHLEMFEVFDAFRKNPRVLEELFGKESYEALLQEGSGAPEARVDFPIFLQTVVHHRIRERFKTVASEWEKFVGIESAQDFREHTVSSLGAIIGFKPVGEGEPYPRLRSSEEEGPPFSVGKWGGIYALTMELVINDEMDRLLNRIPGELGEAAADYVTELVIAFIESNPTYPVDGLPFFHESRENNITGKTAEPTEDNLMAAIDTMKLRRNAENKPIRIEPRRILVRNPSLKAKFDAMIRSQTTGVRSEVTAEGAPQFAPGTDNAVANVLPPDAVVQDSWLNAPNDYYLFNDAQQRPAFVAAFLRGQRTPQMFLQDSGMRGVGGGGADPYSMDFDEIPYKLRHFTGVAAGEPLAASRFQP